MKRLFVTLLLMACASSVSAAESEVITAEVANAADKKTTLHLELATTPEARMHGLMNRKTLAPNDGMAFFFPEISIEKFWMKNTLIPLDMLFVDESGRIVYIATAIPLSLTPVGPDSPVETVIELAGGAAAKRGIAVGDKVHYEIPSAPSHMAR